MLEKRQPLSKKILDPEYDSDDDEAILREWIRKQTSHRLDLDGVSDEDKIKFAKSLIDLYGDKLYYQIYKKDESLSPLIRCEKMLDEIIHDYKMRPIGELCDGNMFGE